MEGAFVHRSVMNVLSVEEVHPGTNVCARLLVPGQVWRQPPASQANRVSTEPGSEETGQLVLEPEPRNRSPLSSHHPEGLAAPERERSGGQPSSPDRPHLTSPDLLRWGPGVSASLPLSSVSP